LHELRDVGSATAGNDLLGHDLAHGPLEQSGGIGAQVANDVALAENARDGAIVAEHDNGADAVLVEDADGLGNGGVSQQRVDAHALGLKDMLDLHRRSSSRAGIFPQSPGADNRPSGGAADDDPAATAGRRRAVDQCWARRFSLSRGEGASGGVSLGNAGCGTGSICGSVGSDGRSAGNSKGTGSPSALAVTVNLPLRASGFSWAAMNSASP